MSVFSRLAISTAPKIRQTVVNLKQPVRHGGSRYWDHNMSIMPSNWSWNQFKDELFKWVTIWAIPLLGSGILTSIFIGDAKLAPIPEGYEPREEEYERNPITRFMIKNIHPTQQQIHEATMHELYFNWKAVQQEMLRKEVRRLAKKDGDYGAWYYSPFTPARDMRVMNERKNQRTTGGGIGW